MLGGLGHDRDFWPHVVTKVLCCDRVWGWDLVLRSPQGSPCVATEFSQGIAIPVVT